MPWPHKDGDAYVLLRAGEENVATAAPVKLSAREEKRSAVLSEQS